MHARWFNAVAGLLMALAVAPGASRAQSASAAQAAPPPWPGIVNNVVGHEPVRRVAGPRGPAGSEGQAGPPGPAGSSIVQVVAACGSCAAADKPETGNPALGPIAGALIAALFGFLGLVIAKENKTSEFRQAWIDALRSDLAAFTSSAQSYALFEDLRQNETQLERQLEYDKIIVDVHQGLVKSQTSIYLRVNQAESDPAMKPLNDKLLEDMAAVRKLLIAEDWEKAKIELSLLHNAAAPVLKSEWDRVKRGEPAYVRAKQVAAVLTLAAVVALAYFLARVAWH